MKNKKIKYKALMLDLDGTTIPNREDGMPSGRVTEAIFRAGEKLDVCVVTSRPYRNSEHIIKKLELKNLSVFSAGAEIRNSQTGEILWSRKISAPTTKEILKYAKKKNLPLRIYDHANYKYDAVFDPDKNPIEPLVITIAGVTLPEGEKIVGELNQFSDITAHKILGWESGTVWISITNIQASKQHGIFEVAKLLNIESKEIIGVGDGYNDFPLLMACGLRVAMGNAVPELKEIADYIAPTVEKDGVADVIKRFIL